MLSKTILIVLTSHASLGDTGKETGFHYEEMTTPYYTFLDAGYDVELASIQGGTPPADPGSLKEDVSDNPDSVQRFLNDEEANAKLQNTAPIKDVDASRYAAIYMPGGHGTMWDFPNNAALGKAIMAVWNTNGVVASVCHGPAAFVGVIDENSGEPLVQGRHVNSFTDAEEKAVDLEGVVPFMLESTLKQMGAKFEHSGNFEAHVAVDDRLVTGQNPASAKPLAEKVIEILVARTASDKAA